MKHIQLYIFLLFLGLNALLNADLKFDQIKQQYISTNIYKNINKDEYHRLAQHFFTQITQGVSEIQLITGLRLIGTTEALLLIEDIHTFIAKLHDDNLRIHNPAFKQLKDSSELTFTEYLFGKEAAQQLDETKGGLLAALAVAVGVGCSGAKAEGVIATFCFVYFIELLRNNWRKNGTIFYKYRS